MEKIETVRECIEAYERRIATEGFDKKPGRNYSFPGNNHSFCLKEQPKILQEIFEGLDNFELYLVNPHQRVLYSMHLKEPRVLFCAENPECFPINFSDYHEKLGDDWTGFNFHPRSRPNQMYLDGIIFLKAILSIAEEHRIPMATEYKTNLGEGSSPLTERKLVTYYPE